MPHNKQAAEAIVNSPAEMADLAARIAVKLSGGMLVLLQGELGAGKTTFVQGVARALGVTGPVTSPTFTLMTEYIVTRHPAITELVHLDLYRLPALSAATDAQVQATITGITPHQVIFIEWPERLGTAIPPHAHRLDFTHGTHPSERRVRGTLLADA